MTISKCDKCDDGFIDTSKSNICDKCGKDASTVHYSWEEWNKLSSKEAAEYTGNLLGLNDNRKQKLELIIDSERKRRSWEICGCRKCNPDAWWMIVCNICGNKRCPHATDHDCACTGSNEPGQPGSVY